MSTTNLFLVVLAFTAVVLNVIHARYGTRIASLFARPDLNGRVASMQSSTSLRASGRPRARATSSRRGFQSIDAVYEKSTA